MKSAAYISASSTLWEQSKWSGLVKARFLNTHIYDSGNEPCGFEVKEFSRAVCPDNCGDGQYLSFGLRP